MKKTNNTFYREFNWEYFLIIVPSWRHYDIVSMICKHLIWQSCHWTHPMLSNMLWLHWADTETQDRYDSEQHMKLWNTIVLNKHKTGLHQLDLMNALIVAITATVVATTCQQDVSQKCHKPTIMFPVMTNNVTTHWTHFTVHCICVVR